MNCFFLTLVALASARLQEGIFEKVAEFTSDAEILVLQRSALKETTVEIKFNCAEKSTYSVEIAIRSSPCFREFDEVLGSSPNGSENLQFYFDNDDFVVKGFDYASFWFYKTAPIPLQCNGHNVHLPGVFDQRLNFKKDAKVVAGDVVTVKNRRDATPLRSNSTDYQLKTTHPAFVLSEDAMYIVMIKIVGKAGQDNQVGVYVEWKHASGYLSPIDWPLLPFYGSFCALYTIYGMAWLILSFLQWRDLLRLQFWIGAVIVLGMFEMAVFYFEYQAMNHSGREAQGAIEFAEIVSCAKRTLSFVLVIFVSVGFGVVKPRLGQTLHKVLAVGMIYFGFCALEGLSRVSKAQHESPKQKLIIAFPLILMQVAMFYWIFTSLTDTIRALRLRRNEAKLTLYRQFTYTVVFCVVASGCFLIWSLVSLKFNPCVRNFEQMWLEDAVWHILFAVLLLVIMILWRPAMNNQRYAFTPLLDNAEDDVDEDVVYNESFADSVKSRNVASSTKAENRKNRDVSFEDEMKWVEQHIPSSYVEQALPSVDDEDVEKTKLEMSKLR